MKHLIIVIVFIFLGIPTSFATGEICTQNELAPSRPETREHLLSQTRENLLGKAHQAIASIQGAKAFIKECNENLCREVTRHFLSALKEQVRISKILTVLSKSDILYYEPILKVEGQLDRNELIADDVMSFKLEGFSFSQEEKDIAFKLWIKTFREFARRTYQPKTEPSGHLQHEINGVFELASIQLVNMNPLLPFINEKSLTEKKSLLESFDRLIGFNKEFISMIQGYEVAHQTGFWSTLNLAANDHEMGLVNFTSNIEEVISRSSDRQQDKYCSAYRDLLKQQKNRVRTSIGVGFSAAVVCGVGIWSGVGTLPAAALCSFSVADGLWGAYVGKQHSNMGYYSIYAGKILNMEKAEFSEGVMSYIDAKQLQNGGNAVFIINLAGLLPIAKSVLSTVKNTHGTLASLLFVPASDVATSLTENGSSQLVYVLLALKGLELSTDNISEIVTRL